MTNDTNRPDETEPDDIEEIPLEELLAAVGGCGGGKGKKK